MALEIEGAAQHLAGVDSGEILHPAALAEPAVADEKRARMMVEDRRQGEALRQHVAELKAIQHRREIDRNDRPPVRIDHAADGDADTQRIATRARQRALGAGGDAGDDLGEARLLARKALAVLGGDLAAQGDEAGVHGIRHEQHAADRARFRREPERARRLAAALARGNRLAFDEQLLIQERLHDAGDRCAVDARLPRQLRPARRPQIEQRLEHSSAVGRADHRGGKQCAAGPGRSRLSRLGVVQAPALRWAFALRSLLTTLAAVHSLASDRRRGASLSGPCTERQGC
jgi:hypothetical protein